MSSQNWNEVYKTGRDFSPMNEFYLSELLDFVLKQRKGKKILNALDLGCGTGDLVVKLAKLKIKTTGVDFSDEALKKAVARAHENKVLTKVNFIKEDLDNIDISKMEKYDLIFSKLTIAFLKNKKRFLKSVNTLLNKNGVFVLITPVLLKEVKYSERLKNISVKKEEIEKLLKSEFIKVLIHRQNYFDDKGIEMVYVCIK